MKKVKSLSVLLAFLGITHYAFAEAIYEIIDLGTLGGNSSIARAINNEGKIVGNSSNQIRDRAFVWSETSGLINLGTLADNYINSYSIARDINNNGLILGHATVLAGSYYSNHNCLWDTNGNLIDLGHFENMYALNDSGVIVGSQDYNQDGALQSQATVWNNNNPTYLGTQYGSWSGARTSTAFDINNSGRIVGGYDADSGATVGYHACYWKSTNTVQDIGTLGGRRSAAYAINDNGDIVGWADYTTANTNEHPFFWSGTTGMVDLGTLGGLAGQSNDINILQQVVGHSLTPDGRQHAFLWDSENGMLDLNDLLGTNSGWDYLSEATSINDYGQIVGYGFTEDGYMHSFLVTPIPEPCTFTLLALGAFLAGRRRRT
jgi:probable HAF family extracellular repeat protein